MSFIKKFFKKGGAQKPRAEKETTERTKVETYAQRIIKQPWLTEKIRNIESQGQYAFIVHTDTNKSEVKKAVEQQFGVRVIKVNIVREKGKRKRWRNSFGKAATIKKAVITVQKGQKIDIG